MTNNSVAHNSNPQPSRSYKNFTYSYLMLLLHTLNMQCDVSRLWALPKGAQKRPTNLSSWKLFHLSINLFVSNYRHILNWDCKMEESLLSTTFTCISLSQKTVNGPFWKTEILQKIWCVENEVSRLKIMHQTFAKITSNVIINFKFWSPFSK